MAQSTQITGVTTWKATRRTVAGGAAMAITGVAGQTLGAQAQATPVAAGATPQTNVGDGRYLFVGDRSQTRVAVYAIPDFGLAGILDDVTFGTHAGALLLPDGRLVFADTTNNEIVALAMDANGRPQISYRVPAELGGGVAWMAADPSFTYLAVGSLQDSETSQYLNIVNLETFENTSLEFTLNEPEEITAWLLNDPLNVYVAVGGQIKAYLLDGLLAGTTEPLTTVEVELGSHGGATDAANARIFYTTAPGTGFEVLDVQAGPAQYLTQIPWDVDGFTGGRNARPRVTHDGKHIFGLLTPGLDDPSLWAETMITNHVTNMADLSAVRLEIGTGNFGYRWGVSNRYALWAGYNADGGSVYVIDADAASATFGAVTATMPIAIPTNAAVPGEDFADTDTYATAITSDSRYGFVSINGDQVVKVFDLEQLAEIAEIPIDFPLSSYDGYLTVIEPGVTPVDIWGR
jgi:hypothetical protein